VLGKKRKRVPKPPGSPSTSPTSNKPLDRTVQTGSYPPSPDELAYDFEITDALDSQKRPLAYEPGDDVRPEIWSLKEPETRWQFSPPPNTPQIPTGTKHRR